MANNFGTGVSRALDPSQRQMVQVIWQEGKPPLDSELNLLQQLAAEWQRTAVLRNSPSGWLGSASNPSEVYETNVNWSNWFKFGRQRTGDQLDVQWAVVNGWLIPVTGTGTGTPPGSPNDSDTWNKITLNPPPSNSGDARIDFVFLEVWQARVPPNPSDVNKPAVDSIYRYGNIEGGYSYLADDLQDSAIGFETTARVQIQYRLRVVSGLVGLTSYPDGFDPSVVKARGAASTDTSFTFTNMAKTLNDPGLWRAGDGSANALNTVDGYTYAIPLAVIFRRNSVAWDGDPAQNLNGGVNRNPTAIDRTGATTFTTTPTLASDLDASSLSLILSSISNIPLPLNPASDVLIRIGDEVMSYSSITGSTMTLTARGAQGTKAESHAAGTEVEILSGRPDGLYADQISKTDLYDVRHVVNPNGFDYDTLLRTNLDRLLRGTMRSNWKRTGAGPRGTFVNYQDKIGSSAALGVTTVGAADNVRQVYSDASVVQPYTAIVRSTTNGIIAAEPISLTWDLSVEANLQRPANTQYIGSAGDTVTIGIAQFKNSGIDSDQVRFATTQDFAGAVEIRQETSGSPLVEGPDYTLTTPTTSDDDLVITFTGSFGTYDREFHIKFHLIYGPGVGLSRRPDSVSSVVLLNPDSSILSQQENIPTNNVPMRAAWLPLWSKHRADSANPTLLNSLPVTAEAYVDPGSKTVAFTPFRKIEFSNYQPLISSTGPHENDPLALFLPAPSTFHFLQVDDDLMPKWGAVRVPIRHTADATFKGGINFGVCDDPTGAFNSDFLADAKFTTWNFVSSSSAAYNTLIATPGQDYAGIRHFTDTRGLGRKGLELPPQYGIARLYAVYEALDFDNPVTPGQPVNLLKQTFDGDTFWIETNSGEETFILNAECIDISRSPNPIVDFASGQYVIEAVIFGFTAGSWDRGGSPFGLLLRTGHADPVDMPTLVIPAPLPDNDEAAINYSRTPYMGDAWASQTTQTDLPYLPGPIASSVAYQLATTELDETALSRPNEKVLEVLSSVSFYTTLGTGRLSGDFEGTNVLTNVCFEDAANYPPGSPTDDRPTLLVGALHDETFSLGTEYLGCTTRLPMGALFRDKDFRGNLPGGGSVQRPLVIVDDHSPGTFAAGIQAGKTYEQNELPVSTSSVAAGHGGEVVVHVDGETGNYGLLTNYRTTRGGSAFVASGPHPGGELGNAFAVAGPSPSWAGVLTGTAYLVRNTPTNIGATEVSAGSELMMLVVTTAQRRGPSGAEMRTIIGTSGSWEGYSAADLYRLDGHPLVNDHVRLDLDPGEVALSRKIPWQAFAGGPLSVSALAVAPSPEPPTPAQGHVIWSDGTSLYVKDSNGSISTLP